MLTFQPLPPHVLQSFVSFSIQLLYEYNMYMCTKNVKAVVKFQLTGFKIMCIANYDWLNRDQVQQDWGFSVHRVYVQCTLQFCQNFCSTLFSKILANFPQFIVMSIQKMKYFEYSQVPNKQVYSFIPNERVGLLFWANFIGLNKRVGWKIC